MVVRCTAVVVVGALACACGRHGFGVLDDAPSDGRPDDARDSGVVGPDAPPSCNGGPFGTPTVLPGPINSTSDDWTPSISASDLTMLFYSQRLSTPGAPDVWISTRSDRAAGFAAASVLADVSSPDSEHDPHMTADELQIIFTSNRLSGGATFDPYLATRISTADPFGTPVRLAELSTTSDEDTVWISADGLRVMVSSNDGASYDIYAAERPDRASAFGAPVLVPGLSTLSVEGSPALSADELEIFFVSNRPGGVGAYDVWRATRPTRSSPFETPTNVTVLNSTDDEWGLSLSADGRTLYYSYNQSIAGGDAEIWTATRDCL